MENSGITLDKNILYLMSTLGALFVGWLLWLTHATFKNKEDIRVNMTSDKYIEGELEKIYKKIDEVKDEFKTSIDRMETRLIREIGLIRGNK